MREAGVQQLGSERSKQENSRTGTGEADQVEGLLLRHLPAGGVLPAPVLQAIPGGLQEARHRPHALLLPIRGAAAPEHLDHQPVHLHMHTSRPFLGTNAV